MNPILKVDHLSGGYSKKTNVIHDVTFEVGKGELVGLVGLNGAGKSTTIKHILGLLEATEGSITVNDQPIQEDTDKYRKQLAYIPETPSLYEQLTLKEHLELTAMAYGLEKQEYENRLPGLLKMFNMDTRLSWFPGHFSKGMKQKVMILCAFLVQPNLYVVDEPFVGLDPIGIQAFLDLMIDMKEKGAGILMSTHILSTAEQYCDRFILLHHGRIALQGTMAELREQVGNPNITLHELYVSVAKGEEPWKK